MKAKKAIWALGLGFVFAQGASAAVIAPSLQVSVDGYEYQVPVVRHPDGSDKWIVDNYYMDAGGDHMMINATLDPDPSIAWGISVTDFGAPSSFSFTFTSPIVPTSSPTTVTASLTGGMTDNTGNGISMTPTQANLDGDLFLELQTSATGIGGPTTNMGVDVGTGFSAPAGLPGALHNYLSQVAGPQLGPSGGPFDVLSSTFAFLGSGDGDIYSMTGFASIETVPEPGMIGLMMLVAPVLVRRRKK